MLNDQVALVTGASRGAGKGIEVGYRRPEIGFQKRPVGGEISITRDRTGRARAISIAPELRPRPIENGIGAAGHSVASWP